MPRRILMAFENASGSRPGEDRALLTFSWSEGDRRGWSWQGALRRSRPTRCRMNSDPSTVPRPHPGWSRVARILSTYPSRSYGEGHSIPADTGRGCATEPSSPTSVGCVTMRAEERTERILTHTRAAPPSRSAGCSPKPGGRRLTGRAA